MKIMKTVMEWNSYITLASKKLDKANQELSNKMYVITTEGEYKLEINKVKIDKEVEEIKNIYTKITKLSSNIEKVKEARQKFNFNTEITVNNETMNIVSALNRYNNRELETHAINSFLNSFNKLSYSLDDSYNNYELNKDRLHQEVSGNNRQATKAELDLIKSRIEDFVPKVFDPLNLKETYTKKKDNLDDFLAEVNAKVNIANAINNLEIDLEQE